MRTNLPTTFAELTIVSIKEGEDMNETIGNFLIKEMNSDGITAINNAGAEIHFPLYSEYVSETPRCANIKLLSDEDDDYMEFVQSVQYADMVKSLEQLGSYVEKEFQKIISVCPENNKSLWEQLKIHIIPEE